MRRTRTLWLCLAALLACAGVAAASASAQEAPVWYYCAKASPKNTGKYADKLCSEPVGGTGKYELVEGVGKDKAFTGKGKTAVLHVKTWLGDDTVECASSKESGKPEAPNLVREVTIHYSKCIALHENVCTSTGAKKGEIVIPGLRGELGIVKESPTEIGLRLESEAHPGVEGELVKFTCEDLEATITGGVIGVVEKDIEAINKEFELVDVPGEYIGEHTYKTYKYTPIVNIPGWASEQEAINKEIEEDEKGEIEKIRRPILKTVVCGIFIEELLHEKCTPEAYSGLTATVVNKGESLEIAPAKPKAD